MKSPARTVCPAALRWFALAAPLVVAACGGAEDAFTAGRSEVSCESAVPVCSTTAGCVLDAKSYLRGSFAEGGTRRAVVRTAGAADLSVALYFRTEESPGTDTEVTWYEVGCKTRFNASSAGRDVFLEAGEGRVWRRTQHVDTAGDHLVEIFSDAQAGYLLAVTINGVQ